MLLVFLFLLVSKHLCNAFHLHFRIFFLYCTFLAQVLAETCSVLLSLVTASPLVMKSVSPM